MRSIARPKPLRSALEEPHLTSKPLGRYNIEKDIAAFIKKEFDKCLGSFSWHLEWLSTAMRKYNPTWHCVVGRNFGSYVTHETKHFIYFYLGQAKRC